MKTLPTITEPAAYRICIAGRVGNGWSDFMADAEKVHTEQDSASTTTITGVVADQAALYGLLCRIRDLGLVLVSVEYLAEFRQPEKTMEKGEAR